MATDSRIWLVCLAVLWAVPAYAIEMTTPWQDNASFNITQSSTFRYQVKDFDSVAYDDEVFMLLNKLNLSMDASPIRLGVRLDSTYFAARPDCADLAGGTCPLVSEHGFERMFPEKLFVTWSGKKGEVTAGDFYTSWGQGLVLNLKKVDELGLDTTLRGGRVQFRHRGLAFEAIGGLTNIQNVELFRGSYEVLEDPNDVMAGAQTLLSLDNGVEVGVRALHTWFETPETLGHEETSTLAGGSLEIPNLGDYLAGYVEAAVLSFRDFNPDKTKARKTPGSALYGRMNGFFGPVSVLLEGKRYREFEFTTRNGTISRKSPVFYHLAPTLERFDQQVFNNTDTTGGRAKVELAVREWKTRFYLNGMWNVYATTIGEDPWGESGRYGVHVYGGVRQKFGRQTSVEASGGWREERGRVSEELYRKLWHVEGDFSFPVGQSQGLAIKSEFRNEVKGKKPFSRTLNTVTYSVQPGFSLSALLGYSSEKVETEPTHHAAGQVDLNISDWGTLRFFGGSVPGGIVCAGGTCVYVPSAVNYRTEIVARF